MATKRHIFDDLVEREQVTQIADIRARRPVTPERRVRESSRAKCAQLNQMLASQRAWEPHERAAAGVEEPAIRYSLTFSRETRAGLRTMWRVLWPILLVIGLVGAALAYWS